MTAPGTHRSSESTQLRRAIADAVWSLEHGYAVGALAILRGTQQQETQRTGDGVR